MVDNRFINLMMFELFVRRRFRMGDSLVCEEVIPVAAVAVAVAGGGGGDDAENADGRDDNCLSC